MPPREKTPDDPALPLTSAPPDAHAERAILDVADGIDRIMGNRDLYARMLTRFRDDYRGGVLPIREALDADRALAHRRAHTLKGSSGMIGAHRLHALACDLELAIRTDPLRETSCLAALAPEFDLVLHAIDGVLASGQHGSGMHAARPSAPPRTLLQDPALLAQLVELLLAGDGAAVDMLEESGTSLRAILGDARLMQVAAAVKEFDYEAALRSLRQTSGAGGS